MDIRAILTGAKRTETHMDAETRESLKENRSHGNAAFPVGVYRIANAAGDPIVACHWHDEAEFFYLFRGEVLFQSGTESFILRAGEAAFVPGGRIHGVFASPSAPATPCEFGAVVFDWTFLESPAYDTVQVNYVRPLAEQRRSLPPVVRGDSDWGRRTLACVEEIVRASERRPPGMELLVKSLMFRILAEIAASGRWVELLPPTRNDERARRLKAALDYMHQHYDRRIRLAELAEIVRMSEGQFCRFFKIMTGKTPIEYLNGYRIGKAAALLADPNRKIHDIALEVGFDSLNHFIRTFRRHMRCTPSQYRRRHDGRPLP